MLLLLCKHPSRPACNAAACVSQDYMALHCIAGNPHCWLSVSQRRVWGIAWDESGVQSTEAEQRQDRAAAGRERKPESREGNKSHFV